MINRTINGFDNVSEIEKEEQDEAAAKAEAARDVGSSEKDLLAPCGLPSGFDLIQGFEQSAIVSGRYKIKSLLARTGNSKVFEAVDSLLDRPVALKLVEFGGLPEPDRTKLFERMLKEIKAASFLKHPNIVEIYSVEMHSDKAVIVMELLRGQSLDLLFAGEGELDQQSFQKLFFPVLDALSFAHEHNILHRDIKPGNIMLVSDENSAAGRVKVLDFGLVKFLEGNEKGSKTLTQGAFAGTPLYMSPEQCAGKECTFASEVYSLACVIYEALSGKPPFLAESAAATMYKHLHETAAPFKQKGKNAFLPDKLEELVLQALSKEPENRPQSMQAFKELLLAALGAPSGKKESASNDLSKLVLLSLFILLIGGIAVSVLKGSSGKRHSDIGHFDGKKSLVAPSTRLKEAGSYIVRKEPQKSMQILRDLLQNYDTSLFTEANWTDLYMGLASSEALLADDQNLSSKQREQHSQQVLNYLGKVGKMKEIRHTLAIKMKGAALERLGRRDEIEQMYEEEIAGLEKVDSESSIASRASLLAAYGEYLVSQNNNKIKRKGMDKLFSALKLFDRTGFARTSTAAAEASVSLHKTAWKIRLFQDEADRELKKTINDLLYFEPQDYNYKHAIDRMRNYLQAIQRTPAFNAIDRIHKSLELEDPKATAGRRRDQLYKFVD